LRQARASDEISENQPASQSTSIPGNTGVKGDDHNQATSGVTSKVADFLFTSGVSETIQKQFKVKYQGDGNLPKISELRYMTTQANASAGSFDIVKGKGVKVICLALNFAQKSFHAGAYSKFVSDNLVGGNFLIQPVETVFSDEVFEKDAVAKFFTGYIAALTGKLGSRTPSKTTPTDVMDKVSDIIHKRIHNHLCSTLTANELLAPCSKETWVEKVEMDLKNLLQSAVAQSTEDGVKYAFKLFDLFDLVFKEVMRNRRAEFLQHFRNIQVDKTWLRRQIIKGKSIQRKVKGKALVQWQDDANLTVSDIIWLSNSEKQGVSQLLGTTWVKAFDEAITRLGKLGKPLQHDSYKLLLKRFESLKTEQTNFVRLLSAKVGVRKKLLTQAGYLGDVKKKDPYKLSVAFIAKVPSERIFKDSSGKTDSISTNLFNSVAKMSSIALLLKDSPLEIETINHSNLTGLVSRYQFEGRLYANADALKHAITMINSSRAARYAQQESEIKTPLLTDNRFGALATELPNSSQNDLWEPQEYLDRTDLDEEDVESTISIREAGEYPAA
jgi:hypothetical protein